MVNLALFKKRKKGSGGVVAVCRDADGACIAHLCRDKDRPARLERFSRLRGGTAAELEREVEQFIKQHELQRTPCVFVLPPETYQLIQVEMADLPESERREAVRWQIREMLDYPVEEAVVDLFDVQPFQSEKNPVSFVVAARQKFLRQQVDLAETTELSLQAIDIPEFALRNLTQLFSEDDRGLAILLLQAQGGLLIIAREDTLYLTRSLTTGMNDLLPLADGNLEALTEQLDSIVLEVQRSFDYCESTFHLPMVSRMLVAQTEREIPAVLSYLGDYLSTKVESFSFAEVMDVPLTIDQLELNAGLLAIGGALRQGTS